MQRHRGAALVELAVAAHRRVGRQALDLHAAPLELGDDRGVRAEPAVGADAELQPPGRLVESSTSSRSSIASEWPSRRHQSDTTRSGGTIRSRVCSLPSTVTRPKL